MDIDSLDIDPGADLDLELALPEVCDEPPIPPVAPPNGGRPGPDHDSWLARSPYWAIPLLVSVIFGIERLAMLAVVPGWRDLPIIVFGSLFIVTFAVVLAAGGLAIGRYRR